MSKKSEEGNLLTRDTLPHQTIVKQLDLKINETSGLVIINDAYWTINDSGDKAQIYQFDMVSGKVTKTIKIREAKNKDWESLTQDDTHLYIGDFGNNTGGRNNLRIFKAEKSRLSKSEIKKTKTISFTYPDQDQFYSGYNHNFDCEAMVSKGDSLYLFSKNWLDARCKLYGLSKRPGPQTATLIDEFDAEGRITGASFNKEKNILYLLGYNRPDKYESFIWKITDWEDRNFFSGNKTRYELSIGRQTEGITVDSDGSLLISAEQNKGGYPSVFRVNL